MRQSEPYGDIRRQTEPKRFAHVRKMDGVTKLDTPQTSERDVVKLVITDDLSF